MRRTTGNCRRNKLISLVVRNLLSLSQVHGVNDARFFVVSVSVVDVALARRTVRLRGGANGARRSRRVLNI